MLGAGFIAKEKWHSERHLGSCADEIPYILWIYSGGVRVSLGLVFAKHYQHVPERLGGCLCGGMLVFM
jgi:hypothetical protein